VALGWALWEGLTRFSLDAISVEGHVTQMAKRKTEHWAYQELRKRLDERTESWVPHLQDASDVRILRITKTPDHESGTVFLIDPRAVEAIDEILLEQIYPHILQTMEGESLIVPTIKKITKQVRTGDDSEPTRFVTFAMTDPARPPLTKERPLWRISFDLKVHVSSYMFSCNCSISIPFPVAGPWLLDALTDPLIQEASPQLYVELHQFVINVSCSRGQGFFGDEWKTRIAESLKRHLVIANAVDRFERSPYDYIVRNQMLQTISESYQTLLRVSD